MVSVSVFVKSSKVVYVVNIQCETFEEACAVVLELGLHTSDENGCVWFPPNEIEAVRMAGDDGFPLLSEDGE